MNEGKKPGNESPYPELLSEVQTQENLCYTIQMPNLGTPSMDEGTDRSKWDNDKSA